MTCGMLLIAICLEAVLLMVLESRMAVWQRVVRMQGLWNGSQLEYGRTAAAAARKVKFGGPFVVVLS